MKANYYRLFIIVGIVSTLLFACSPPGYDTDVIENINVYDNTIYVRASKDCNVCEYDPNPIYFSSIDNGQTWNDVPSLSDDMLQVLNFDETISSSICLSRNSQICYRITDDESIQISRDGGDAWEIDWQIPYGRKYYMERYVGYYPAPNTVPLDLEIVESETEYFVYVAMGNQGVMVKSGDGIWNRYAVRKATPAPFQASSFAEANGVLSNEQIVIVLISICFFLILSLSVCIIAYLKADAMLLKKILGACLPLFVSLALFILYWVVSFTGVAFFIPYSIEVLFIVSPLLGIIATWLVLFIVAAERKYIVFAFFANIGFSFLSYFLIIFSFQLWALGVISVYETSFTSSWVIGIGTLITGIMTVNKITPLAVKISKGDL